jgi:hypothetical protein
MTYCWKCIIKALRNVWRAYCNSVSSTKCLFTANYEKSSLAATWKQQQWPFWKNVVLSQARRTVESRKPVPLGTSKYKKVSKRKSYYSNILGESCTSSTLEVFIWGMGSLTSIDPELRYVDCKVNPEASSRPPCILYNTNMCAY